MRAGFHCDWNAPAWPSTLRLAMASAADVSASITHLVSMEVIERLFAPLRMGTRVAVMRIETVIDVAAEVVRPMKPGAGSDKHAAVEPLWPVISVWCAVVWSEIVVAIRTPRF